MSFVYEIPTQVRERLLKRIKTAKHACEAQVVQGKDAFLFNLDENVRATTLHNLGKIEAYNHLITLLETR